jgi:hypothetical protein
VSKRNWLWLFLFLVFQIGLYSPAYSQQYEGLIVSGNTNSVVQLKRLKINLTADIKNDNAAIESWSLTRQQGILGKRTPTEKTDFKILRTNIGLNLLNQQNIPVYSVALSTQTIQLTPRQGTPTAFWLIKNSDKVLEKIDKQVEFINNKFYETLGKDILAVIGLQARWLYLDTVTQNAKGKLEELKKRAQEANANPKDNTIKQNLKTAKTELDKLIFLAKGLSSKCEFNELSDDLRSYDEVIDVPIFAQLLPVAFSDIANNVVTNAKQQITWVRNNSSQTEKVVTQIKDLERQEKDALDGITLD